VLPFGRLWYDTPDDAVGYAIHNSRSHDAVIRVYDDAGNVIQTHEHKGDSRWLPPVTVSWMVTVTVLCVNFDVLSVFMCYFESVVKTPILRGETRFSEVKMAG
jgi:hypothetical protein